MQQNNATNPIKELIDKIQDNHKQLTMDESDKFRIIFDRFNKYKKLSLDDLSWLQNIADCKLKTVDC